MKPLRSLAQAVVLSAALHSIHAQATNTNNPAILGQWDFNSPTNLAAATIGSPLVFNLITPQYTTSTINDTNAGVVSLVPTNVAQRILATFTSTNNGGGTNLNQYTIIIDLMYPPESDALWRGIFNADTANTNDSEIFVDPDDLVGNFNNYAGRLVPNEWYRLVLTYNLTSNQWARYIDGTNVLGPQAGPSSLPLPEGKVDGEFSLNNGLLFFSDNDGEVAPVFVNVIQLRAGALTSEEVRALGGPGTGGLGTGGEPLPVGDITIEKIVRNGANVEITVNNGGRRIQLQRTPDLGDPQWTNEEDPTTASTIIAPITGNLGFFRVQAL